MTRYILLNQDDVHQAGDEIWDYNAQAWRPVLTIHYGDSVGESAPCRRLLSVEIKQQERLIRAYAAVEKHCQKIG